MHDWQTVRVEDVAEVVGGATPRSGVAEYWDGDIPWLTPKDLSLRPSLYTVSGERFISESGLKSCGTKLVPKGAVLLTSRAPVGYVTIAANDVCTNQGFKSLILFEDQSPEFWYYLLGHSTRYLESRSGGSTFKELSGTALKGLKFKVPSLPEQKRIVDLMISVDGAISENERLVESIGNSRSAMLTTLLSGNSDADGDAWQSKVLADLCGDGGTIQTGPFGSQLHSYDYVDEGTPVVMPTNMWHGRIVLDGIARVKEEDRDRLSRHSLRTGDIVYSRRGDVTKSAQVTQAEEGFLCGTGCLLVRPNSDVHSDWLYHWLNRDSTKKWVVDHAVGATMANLNTKILGRVPVDVPPAGVQREIAALANAFDAMDQTARENLLRYRDLRSNILSSLLSGGHRIPESYDELLGLAA